MVFFVIFFAQLGASVIQAIGIPSLGTWYDWNFIVIMSLIYLNLFSSGFIVALQTIGYKTAGNDINFLSLSSFITFIYFY